MIMVMFFQRFTSKSDGTKPGTNLTIFDKRVAERSEA